MEEYCNLIYYHFLVWFEEVTFEFWKEYCRVLHYFFIKLYWQNKSLFLPRLILPRLRHKRHVLVYFSLVLRPSQQPVVTHLHPLVFSSSILPVLPSGSLKPPPWFQAPVTDSYPFHLDFNYTSTPQFTCPKLLQRQLPHALKLLNAAFPLLCDQLTVWSERMESNPAFYFGSASLESLFIAAHLCLGMQPLWFKMSLRGALCSMCGRARGDGEWGCVWVCVSVCVCQGAFEALTPVVRRCVSGDSCGYVYRGRNPPDLFTVQTQRNTGVTVCVTHTLHRACCAFGFNPHAALHFNFTAIKGKACTHEYKTGWGRTEIRIERHD